MAFTIENGSGIKGATSYVDVAFFKSYWTDRGIDVTSSMTDAVIQACLVKATDYIDTRWGLKFKGSRYWTSLYSRSTFTLSDQPSDGETVTVGSAVATFKTTAVDDTDAEIGNTLYETLCNLAVAIAQADLDLGEDSVLVSTLIPDADTAALTVYVDYDGISVATDAANGSWDNAATTGWSRNQQPLEFPRADLYDRQGNLVEGIPDRVQEATCEYAYRANSAALAPDPTVDATGLQVTGSRSKVGPIETQTTYSSESSVQITKPYPAADRLLQEYVKSGSSFVRT